MLWLIRDPLPLPLPLPLPKEKKNAPDAGRRPVARRRGSCRRAPRSWRTAPAAGRWSGPTTGSCSRGTSAAWSRPGRTRRRPVGGRRPSIFGKKKQNKFGPVDSIGRAVEWKTQVPTDGTGIWNWPPLALQTARHPSPQWWWWFRVDDEWNGSNVGTKRKPMSTLNCPRQFKVLMVWRRWMMVETVTGGPLVRLFANPTWPYLSSAINYLESIWQWWP